MKPLRSLDSLDYEDREHLKRCVWLRRKYNYIYEHHVFLVESELYEIYKTALNEINSGRDIERIIKRCHNVTNTKLDEFKSNIKEIYDRRYNEDNT